MEKPAAASGTDMYSSVTGTRVDDDLTAQYWVDNLVSPVRFTDALLSMTLESSKGSLRVNTSNTMVQEIVEIGPHSALRSAIKEVLASQSVGSQPVAYYAVLDRNSPGTDTILNSVGALYARGTPVDLSRVNRASKWDVDGRPSEMLVNLPPYVFNHSQTTWYESRLSRNFRLRKHPRHDLFGAPVPDWNIDEPAWRNFIRISEQPWLRDHVVSCSRLLRAANSAFQDKILILSQVTGSIVYPGYGNSRNSGDFISY
jgi:acyl transferase domain-containing protein